MYKSRLTLAREKLERKYNHMFLGEDTPEPLSTPEEIYFFNIQNQRQIALFSLWI